MATEPTYNVGGHPLLSPAANALATGALTEHALLAESLLGLAGSTYTGREAEDATRAVALQVNLQVESDVEPFILSAVTRGARSATYRGVSVHPTASALVRALAQAHATETDPTTGWRALRSLRTGDC